MAKNNCSQLLLQVETLLQNRLLIPGWIGIAAYCDWQIVTIKSFCFNLWYTFQ